MNESPQPDLPPPDVPPPAPTETLQPARSVGRGRSRAAILAMTLLAGMVGGAWLMKRFGPEPAPPVAASSEPAAGLAETMAAAPPATPAEQAGSETITAFESNRIAALEQRMSEINLQNRAGSANESRAEGLLVAFAARRAVERGQSLGYIDGELRQRFGGTMPRAVSTILDAANRRITADKLRERLEQLEPSLMAQEGSAAGLWASVTNLFVVRSENAPLIDPAQRMARAKRALDVGRVDRAILEVEKLPGAAKAQEWLVSARHYTEAQQALDLIEAAAIQGPQSLHDIATTPVEPATPDSAPPAAAPAPANPPAKQ